MTCLTLALSRQKILLVFMSMCVKQVVLISLECIYHFRHELNRVTEYPVLIVVDDLNMFQNNSNPPPPLLFFFPPRARFVFLLVCE